MVSPSTTPRHQGHKPSFSNPLDNLESVTIEKGLNSVSEGAHAVAAVIKIKTLKNKNTFQVGGGSYGSSKLSLGFNSPFLGLQLGLQKSDSLSAMKNNNDDKDNTVKKNGAVRVSTAVKGWNWEAKVSTMRRKNGMIKT